MNQNSKSKCAAVCLSILLSVTLLSGCVTQSVRLSEEDKNNIGDAILLIKKPSNLRMIRHNNRFVSLANAYLYSGEMVRMQIDEGKTENFSKISSSLNDYFMDEKLLIALDKNIKKSLGALTNKNIIKMEYVHYLDIEDIGGYLKSKKDTSIIYVDYDFLFTPGMELFDVKAAVEIYSPSQADEEIKLIFSGNYFYQTPPATSGEIKRLKSELKNSFIKWGKVDEDSEVTVPYPFNNIVDLLNSYAMYWAKDNATMFMRPLNESIVEISKMIEIDLLGKHEEESVSLPYKDYRGVQPFSKKGQLFIEGRRIVNSDDREILRGPKGALFSLKNTNDLEFNSYRYGLPPVSRTHQLMDTHDTFVGGRTFISQR